MKTTIKMEKQIEKFDPSKLMDGVKDRIKATFVSLIPDEQWEVMCDTEMKKFFEPTYGGYDNRDKRPAQFEILVKELMNEHCRNYLKELLASPDYSMKSIWKQSKYSNVGGQEITLSAHLDEMIKEQMPYMMKSMLDSIMANAFYTFFNQIQNQLQNR